jgi:hypothetical protein
MPRGSFFRYESSSRRVVESKRHVDLRVTGDFGIVGTFTYKINRARIKVCLALRIWFSSQLYLAI